MKLSFNRRADSAPKFALRFNRRADSTPKFALRFKGTCAIALFSLLFACGRKATSADCELIIDRNVEVQMKAMHIDDAPTISKKQEELRTQMKDDMKDCEGRRVTDKMMACVRGAQTGDEVTECLR